MNPKSAKARALKPGSNARPLKHLGYKFPVIETHSGLSFRFSKKALLNWAFGGMVVVLLVCAQCTIDIPGVDIPDLKDIPGVLSLLQNNGISQMKLDIFGAQ